ncbi:MAG: hypothetical protein JW913_06185 [Chitinispirillaceae bacterium]|nr:hypothetical protein [Chitinispirillaceae bacterium]
MAVARAAVMPIVKRGTMLPVVLITILVFSFAGDASVDSTAYRVLIKNVTVPKELITHDSTVNGRNYFSGIVTYDLESDLDSVDVHVYLEDVPFQRYYITGKTLTVEYSDTGYHYGHVRFIRIDSLCSGDVGKISPKAGCRVYWSYSTTNPKNHCRIKVGVGNFQYVLTGILTEGEVQPNSTFKYNNLGLIRELAGQQYPKYTLDGQMVVDDTASPLVVCSYDENGRLIYKDNMTYGPIFTFYYDSCSRLICLKQHENGATPENPGIVINNFIVTYGDDGYVHSVEKKAGYLVTACSPVWEFIGTEITTYYYSVSVPGRIDSLYREMFETTRNNKLVSRIINKFESFDKVGHVTSVHSIVLGLDDPGTCWDAGGISGYGEGRAVYYYDSFGNLYRWESYRRDSPDKEFEKEFTSCYRREYDDRGNVLRQYTFCDTSEILTSTYEYNRFNHVIRNASITYAWDLIDLDEQEEALYEHAND